MKEADDGTAAAKRLEQTIFPNRLFQFRHRAFLLSARVRVELCRVHVEISLIVMRIGLVLSVLHWSPRGGFDSCCSLIAGSRKDVFREWMLNFKIHPSSVLDCYVGTV